MDSADRFAQFQKLADFIGFDDRDRSRLVELKGILVPEQDRITDAFYESIQREPETRAFVEGRVEALKKTHARWFSELFDGEYGEAYFEGRWKIGMAHVRIGLSPRWVDMVVTHIHELVLQTLNEKMGEAGVQAHQSFARLLDLDRAIIQLAYDEDRLDRLSDFTGMKRTLIENVIRIAK